MALTYDEAVEEIRKEVKNDSEKFELYELAMKHERHLRPLKASEVVPFLRRKRDSEGEEKEEQRQGQKRASETEVRKVAAEEAAKVFEARLKRFKVSVTNVAEVGESVLEEAETRSSQLFEELGWADQENATLKEVAEALKQPYEALMAEVERAAIQKVALKEKHVQAFSKTMYDVLQQKHPRGVTLIGDTSATGLGGGKNKVDLVLCERAVQLPHVIFPHENKPGLTSDTQQKQGAGQLVQRKERIFEKQPLRSLLTAVTMGCDSIDFWSFRKECVPVHTGPLPLSADASSPALQGMWRLWRTANNVLGYMSPALPDSVKMVEEEQGYPKGAIIDNLTRLDVMPGNENDPSTSLTTAEVLQGVIQETGDVVALKHGAAIDKEIRNMRKVAQLQLDGVIRFCGIAKSTGGRRWLVTTPVGRRIDDGDAVVVIDRFRSIATTVAKLYQNGFIHGDLSFNNLISTDNGSKIMDWGTLHTVGGDWQAGTWPTGTPLYMALSVLEGGRATVSSELECLANVLAHIATEDAEHWRHKVFGTRGMVDAKFAGWTHHFKSNMLPKISDKLYKAVICNLQALFFPNGGNRTDVTVNEFLEALKV